MVNEEWGGVPKLLVRQKNASGKPQGNGTVTESRDRRFCASSDYTISGAPFFVVPACGGAPTGFVSIYRRISMSWRDDRGEAIARESRAPMREVRHRFWHFSSPSFQGGSADVL